MSFNQRLSVNIIVSNCMHCRLIMKLSCPLSKAYSSEAKMVSSVVCRLQRRLRMTSETGSCRRQDKQACFVRHIEVFIHVKLNLSRFCSVKKRNHLDITSQKLRSSDPDGVVTICRPCFRVFPCYRLTLFVPCLIKFYVQQVARKLFQAEVKRNLENQSMLTLLFSDYLSRGFHFFFM